MKRNSGNGDLPVFSFSGMIDKIFQDNLNRFFDDDFWGGYRSTNVPVNVRQTADSYELELIAPGLRKEDFKINVKDDMLTVAFEQQEEDNQENKDEGWLRREHKTRSFSRSFRLDDTIDVNKVTAA